MKTLDEVQTWRGMKVVDVDGDKIGTLEEIFLDRQTGEPAWATVKTGLFGRKSNFVPIRDAEVIGDNEVRVPFQKEQVKNAPSIDVDGELSPDEERRLWEHYGRSDYDEWQGDDRTTSLVPAEEGRAERSGETGTEGGTPPAVVGVRLRRYMFVAAVPGGPPADRDRVSGD